VPVSPGSSIADVRWIAAVEAQRLRDGADAPTYRRREMLADLASRLGVLLRGLADPAYTPLRDLVATLGTDADLDARWSEAIAVLSAFAGDAGRAPARARKPFWKR
jgi:Ca-activated chloride channel homolog